MSDLPRSAADAVPPDNTSQWLRNLDVDFDASTPVPTTPCSSRPDEVSTPALPQGIEESEGTATPQRFEPEDDDGARTISTDTYDDISEYTSSLVLIFVILFFSSSIVLDIDP